MTIYVSDRSNNDPPTDGDLDAMRAGGIRGLILKATEGTGFVDPTFVDRARAARARGFDLGAYAFIHADQSAAAQATLFNSVVAAAGVHIPVRCADAETADGNVQAVVDEFCPAAAVNLLYSGAAFARADISQPVPGVLWWIAAYGQAAPPTPPWGIQAGWQFTDASQWGDLSIFADAQWATLIGAQAPLTQEDDMPPLWYRLDIGGGHYYLVNRDTGEVNASAGSSFVNYILLAVDDAGAHEVYAFGPNRNGGVFAYPGLPAASRQGNRRFVEAWLG